MHSFAAVLASTFTLMTPHAVGTGSTTTHAHAPNSTIAAAAVAFWKPYHDGPVCPQGVRIVVAQAPDDTFGEWIPADSLGSGDCVVYVNRDMWPDLNDEERCDYITHGLGHNVMGLDDSMDAGNIMYREQLPSTAQCHALRARTRPARARR